MSTNNFETITYEVANQIGFITMNREKKLNALNSQVLSELKELLSTIKNEKTFETRGLIITGAGEKAFIAGADISEMSGMSVEKANEFGKLGQDVSLLFESVQIPVIACVNGFALGGGCEMAMSCDFIYATQNAVFGQPEVKLGLIPGYGGTQRLSKLIGRNRAKEIVYSGRNMKVDEALSLGLVLKSFETKEEMIEAAKVWMKKAFNNSPNAIATAKEVMNEGNDLTVEQGLSLELKQFSKVFSSEDMKEGTAAFIEKRAPQFVGR